MNTYTMRREFRHGGPNMSDQGTDTARALPATLRLPKDSETDAPLSIVVVYLLGLTSVAVMEVSGQFPWYIILGAASFAVAYFYRKWFWNDPVN